MKMRRRKYSKRRKVGVCLLLLLFLITFLASCIASSGEVIFEKVFQKDTSVYADEPILNEIALDGAEVTQMQRVVDMLVMGNTSLPLFERPSESLSLYRDAVLNALLRDHYSLYTGNSQNGLQAEGARATLTTAIPASDFENAVRLYFGNINVRHKSGAVYSYEARENAYVTALQPWACDVEMTVTQAQETENTYRLYFTLSDAAGNTASYYAMFIKRAESAPYLQMLKQI